MTRVLTDVVEVVPTPLKVLIAALGALAIMLLVALGLAALRARRLARQQQLLIADVGALQAAVLPPPRTTDTESLVVTAAYRPAEGPAAGGDFYDVFELSGDRTCVLVGDLSGHGRDALAATAFLRYTLRAYVEAGLDLRTALKLADRALERSPHPGFATVLLAVHDPTAGTLTWAAAGHPPPIVIGDGAQGPVTASSSPPLGLELATGLRQTTVPLSADSVACIYTDGVEEARMYDGSVLGRPALEDVVAQLPPGAEAHDLIEHVRARARDLPDDVAVCLLWPRLPDQVTADRLEELEVAPGEEKVAARFLRSCGVPLAEVYALLDELAHALDAGVALVRVRFENGHRHVEITPRELRARVGFEAA